ncbi:MAG: type IV pilus twitching motility protein PilT [Bacteriovoracaceae bacterium]|nr:type IV pilus twitching motility protein PilT [Bacteriovoracaceae bacterium]
MEDKKSGQTVTQQKKFIDESIQISQLFKVMADHGASDLHLSVGSQPCLRIHGVMTKIKVGLLREEDTKRLIYQVLTDEQKQELEEKLELDFSFGVKGLSRFRANVFYAKGGLSASFRHLSSVISDFQALQLPNTLLSFTHLSNGLVLCTGPTGSGKTTTLAAILDKINSERTGHIVTLEDPIEYIHEHRSCLVNQREVGKDSNSFASGLRSLLRQDPDFVMVGEMRDLETIEAALTVAETGHLVFGTLHTNSAIQTINRIISVFPAEQQAQVRTVLSFVLQGVIAQQLIPKSFGGGRAIALEVLIVTPAIRNLIRENKIHQIYSQMQVGQENTGMITMNQSLAKLVKTGIIDKETVLAYSSEPEELAKMLGIRF